MQQSSQPKAFNEGTAWSRRTWLAGVLVAAVLAGAGLAAGLRQQAAAAAAPIYLGVWEPGTPWNMSSLQAFDHDAARTPAIVMWYQSWADSLSYGPDPSILNAVVPQGAIQMISWEPQNYQLGADQPDFSLATIASGRYDGYIHLWARGLAAYGKPIMLRWAHEMNGNWYPWGAGNNGNTPAQYVAAWRHLHDIFVADGATNVQWVWSPNVVGADAMGLEEYYPGDAYVDWSALDGYNRSEAGWRTFTELFQPSYQRVLALTNKPMMVAEVGSSENILHVPGVSKAQWITSALTSELPLNFPRIRALVWFNADTSGIESRGYDWRIESSAAAMTAFAAAVARPDFVSTFAGATTIAGDGATACNGVGRLPDITARFSSCSISDGTLTLTWDAAGSGSYSLCLGTAEDQCDLADEIVSDTGTSIAGLPSGTIYIRLYSTVGDTVLYTDDSVTT